GRSPPRSRTPAGGVRWVLPVARASSVASHSRRLWTHTKGCTPAFSHITTVHLAHVGDPNGTWGSPWLRCDCHLAVAWSARSADPTRSVCARVSTVGRLRSKHARLAGRLAVHSG